MSYTSIGTLTQVFVSFNIVCLLKELLPQATSVHGLRAAVHEPARGSQEIRQECRPSYQGSQVRKLEKSHKDLFSSTVDTDLVSSFFAKVSKIGEVSRLCSQD
jgi:hypothetical protein